MKTLFNRIHGASIPIIITCLLLGTMLCRLCTGGNTAGSNGQYISTGHGLPRYTRHTPFQNSHDHQPV